MRAPSNAELTAMLNTYKLLYTLNQCNGHKWDEQSHGRPYGHVWDALNYMVEDVYGTEVGSMIMLEIHDHHPTDSDLWNRMVRISVTEIVDEWLNDNCIQDRGDGVPRSERFDWRR